ncbi:meiotic recombination [Rhodotorula kratochvilovae]
MSSSPAPEGGFAGPVPKLTQAVAPDNCIKVLLATDNHIGYAEKDPIRGRDSINTFKEILDLAVENDVDMLLLAGDLFHENRPSRTALYQTISALRERCLSDRPIALELVSDAGIGIPRDVGWPGVNYEDENINVGLPVFSIHGNHDDPQGVGAEGALCTLDVLSASGLINYFGRMELPGQATDDAEALEDGLKVKPVLLQKGDTKLALYGMGNIRDDRFVFELTNRRINLYRPAEDPEDWFNIILVHQNRVAHGPNNSVPDEAFGEEAHLVVWGHEHDCIEQARPQPVTGRPYYISQPGSSIATSLAKGEAIPKHVGLIKIQGKEFEFEPIRLRSVRPYVFEEISLLDYHEDQTDDRKKLTSKVAVNKYLKSKVDELIARANQEWDELHPDEPELERLLPLIRLRVDYSHGPDGNSYFEVGNPQRFGQDFVDKVANPRDLVQFHRKSATRKAVTINQPNLKDLDAAMAEAAETGDLSTQFEKITVQSLVHEYLEAQNLNVLSESLIQNAVDEFVGKGDKDAVGNWVKKLLRDTRNEILKKGFEPSKEGYEHDNLDEEMRAAKGATEAKYGGKGKGKGKAAADEDDEEEEEEDDDGSEASTSRARSRGKSTAASSKAKGKGKARAEPDSMDDESDDSMAGSSGSARPAKGKGKAPAKKAPAKKVVASKAKGKGKALFNESEDEDESEDDVPKKKAPVKKAPAKKVATTTAKKPPARSAAKKATQSITIETDSDDSSVDAAPARKRKR